MKKISFLVALTFIFSFQAVLPVSGDAKSSATPPFQVASKCSVGGSYLSVYPPAPFDSGYLVGNASGKLVYIKAGMKKFELEIDGADIASSPLVYNASCFVGTKAGTLALVDLLGKKIVWSFRAGNAIYGMPVLFDGKIIFGCSDGNLYCLNATNGSLVFRFDSKSPIWGTPAIYAGSVVFGGDDNRIRRISVPEGKTIWSFETGGWVETQPLVSGQKIIAGSLDHVLYCLNAEDGSLLWRYIAEAPIRSNPVLIEGKCIFADESGILYSVDVETGRQEWKKEGFGPVSWPLATDGRSIYFIDGSKIFWGIDPEGSVVWKRKLIHATRSSVLIEDGRISYVTSDGQLFCWDECPYVEVLENRDLGTIVASDGTRRFSFTLLFGRKDGRLPPPKFEGMPFEAGSRCKSVSFIGGKTFSEGMRRGYKYTMIIDPSDPSFCDGKQKFGVAIEPGCPVMEGDGQYNEPGISGWVLVFFTVDVVSQQKKCQTCEPCFDVVVNPSDAPYFPRSSQGQFEVRVNSTDGEDRYIRLDIDKPDWLKVDGQSGKYQENGTTSFSFSFNCMDLPGGSDFSVPIKITCNTCPERNGGMSSWEDELSLDFVTDPRLRIQMEPGSNEALINNGKVTLDVPAEVYKGRTLVPIRFIAETFGCKVDWNATEKKVEISRKGKILKYWIGEDKAEFDNKVVKIDVGPLIRNGRTLVPLRSVAESLGATVRWISVAISIIIDMEF